MELIKLKLNFNLVTHFRRLRLLQRKAPYSEYSAKQGPIVLTICLFIQKTTVKQFKFICFYLFNF